MNKLFEVQQKVTLLVNEYHILKDGELIAFARQKRLTLREHFSLSKDKSQSETLAISQARQVIDYAPTFDITDNKGKHLATIRKNFKKSLIRSSWSIYSDATLKNQLFTVQEKSQAVAIIRRIWELVPFDVAEIPLPIKFHFTISQNGKPVGEYTKLKLFRDHYALYLNAAQAKRIDKRAWMIFAVLLDAMQSR